MARTSMKYEESYCADNKDSIKDILTQETFKPNVFCLGMTLEII